jgi:site-specific DNA recombinase
MFEVAASGLRPTAIAESANSRGWRTKIMVARHTAKQRGGNLWTARQVVAPLSNQVYIGRLIGGATGLHEPLVKPELFDAAAEQLRSRQTRLPGRKYEIRWALKGIVVCAACGRGMSPHTVRHRNIIYCYYRCRSTAGGQPPCGYQIAAFMLESSVRGALWRRGVKIEADEIRTHVGL